MNSQTHQKHLFLTLCLGILMLLSGCQTTPKLNPFEETPNPDVPAEDTKKLEQTLEKLIYQQVNQYRLSRNLPPLEFNAVISQQAKLHSQKMAQGIVPFSHDGFKQRAKNIESKILYQSAAENVAFNQGYQDPVTIAVQGWLKSDGHRRNIEGKYNLTGIGVAKNTAGEYYFTQIFILIP